MAYFSYTEDSQYYLDEWQELLDYIQTDWPPGDAAHLGDLVHHIEAKALYVFTMSRHLIESAEKLPVNDNWSRIFIEATILLFPMIELVGEARLGKAQDPKSWRRLASGIDWLADPTIFPTRPNGSRNTLSTDAHRVSTLGSNMPTLPIGPRVQELYHLRNYLMHGLKNHLHRSAFDIGAVQSSMNYELPSAMIAQAKVGLATYWSQLRNDDGADGWVTRLAEANIYPFRIMGSGIYEKGLIDPDIVYWLSQL